jgi:gliding-associated putative ABC transporter substrate-binding component GldG
MAMNKRTRAATESIAFLGAVAGILVLCNVLGVFFFGRLDVTQNKLFSLSDGSKRVVQNLEDNLEVTAYFTKDLPPPFNATERYVRDLLEEYATASNGKFKLRFVNPAESEELQKQAEAEGVQRVAHQKIENDAVQVVEGYRGIVFNYLGERRAIPAVSGTEGLEYDITQTLKELAGEKIKIGVLGGHEGPTLAQGLTVLKQLLPTYDVVETSAASPIDKTLQALLVVAPENPLSEDELRNIDAFVMNGGSLGVFGGTLKVKQEQAELTATPVDTGLNRLLEKWGVRIGKEVLADAQCGQAPFQTPMGIQIPVAFPPVPIISFDDEQSKHPAAYRLNQVFLPFGAPLQETGELKADKDVKLTVLARTTKNSWLLTGESIDLKPRHPREWVIGEQRGPFPMAIAIEGKLPSAFRAEAVSSAEGAAPQGPRGPERATKPVHVLVVGSSGFVRDEFLPPPDRAGQRDINSSVAFGLNAVDWLAQEDALIAIRAKSVEDPVIEVPQTVKEAETEVKDAAKQGDEAGAQAALDKRKVALEDWDQKKARYKLFNVIFMPALLVAFGLVRWQLRKKKRKNLSV